MLSRKEKPQYKYLLFLAMGYITAILISVVLFNKVIKIGPFLFEGGLLTYPIIYSICDITAEVYGYNITKKMIWGAIIWGNLFALLTTAIINLPSPEIYNHNSAYQTVLGYDFRLTSAGTLAYLCASFTTAYLMTRFKVFFGGKYFIARYITSIAIGELIDTFIVFSIGFAGRLPMSKIADIMVSALTYKIAMAFVLIIPAVMLTQFLKRAEDSDVYDYRTSFNPFRRADKTDVIELVAK